MTTAIATRAALFPLATAAALVIAACGSSGTSAGASADSSTATPTPARTASSPGAAAPGGSAGEPTGRRGGPFRSLTTTQRSCLTSHGVTIPSGAGRSGAFSGGGFTASTGGHSRFGAGTRSKHGAAFKECGISVPTGFGRGGGAGTAGARLSATALRSFQVCVQKNGYDLTSINTTGSGPVLPTSLRTNKTFLAAAAKCTADLR